MGLAIVDALSFYVTMIGSVPIVIAVVVDAPRVNVLGEDRRSTLGRNKGENRCSPKNSGSMDVWRW